MKKTELRNLANKIAAAELVIQSGEDKDAVRKAQEEIVSLSRYIDIFDLDLLDEMVQEILKKNLKQ